MIFFFFLPADNVSYMFQSDIQTYLVRPSEREAATTTETKTEPLARIAGE